MKKIISVLLVLCIMLASVVCVIPQASAKTTYGYLLGDVDDDNDITMKDVLLIRKYVAGVLEEKDINCLAADTDKDTDVTLKDVLQIRKAVAGVLTFDGVNEDGRYKIDTISIGGKNISRFKILLPKDATLCMENAAKTLRAYIERACGYSLGITDDENSANRYRISFSFDKNGEYELGLEGYRVFVNDSGDLEVICGSLRGPIYSAYFILEELIGYRFFPGNDVYLYKNENLNVPYNFDVTEIPGYEYRSLAECDHDPNAIALRLNDSGDACNAENGWRVGSLFIHAHSYAYQIAGYDHIYDEAYASQFHNTQPCLTKEETYEKIVDYNLKLLAERERGGQHLGEVYTQISCSPNDNTNFCQCNDCKKIYETEGSIAGTVFRMSNRVIEAMREVYPTIELYTIAYWDARNPPKFTRPDDAICVCFCIGGCNNHSFDETEKCVENGGNPRLQSPSGENSNNEEDIRFVKGWAELTNNLQVWYYSVNFCYYMAPSPIMENIYKDFRYLHDIGATGMYTEGSGVGFTFEKLKGYLASKMMWNPTMSEDEFNELMNEYLMFYYGEGWKYIREYFDMLNEAGDLQGCWTNNYDRPWNIYNEEYFKDNYCYMVEILDKAYDFAKTNDEKRHINECRLSSDFLGLSATYECYWENGDKASKEFYAKRYKFLYDYIVDHSNEGIRMASFEITNFPKSSDIVYNPMTWLLPDFTGRWEWTGERWI